MQWSDVGRELEENGDVQSDKELCRRMVRPHIDKSTDLDNRPRPVGSRDGRFPAKRPAASNTSNRKLSSA